MLRTHWRSLGSLLSLFLLLVGCGEPATPLLTPTTAPPAAAPASTVPPPARPEILLATTTSTQDSGLLDVLLPDFQQRTGYHVKPIAVGSGAALTLGEQGNADVLLVHSPAAEQTFMQTGAGVDRRLVMHNDFVIVGPPADPAQIAGRAPGPALQAIAATGARWVSRDDKSGTNALELQLWQTALSRAPAQETWYIRTGQGMGATLNVTNERQAYTLSDRATYLAFSDKINLKILVEKDPLLLNVYHVIRVNPEKWPQSNVAGAQAFADYLISPAAQQLIGTFGVAKYHQALFVPDAGKAEDTLGR